MNETYKLHKLHIRDRYSDRRIFDDGVNTYFRDTFFANGKELIFKSSGDYRALSEVFHSRVAEMVGVRAVKNELASVETEQSLRKGIVSENFLVGNQKSVDISSLFNTLKSNLYFQTDTKFEQYIYNKCLPLLNIQKFMDGEFKNENDNFRNDFVKVWLYEHAIQNFDTFGLYNIGCIGQRAGLFRKSNLEITPVYDFALCNLFDNRKAEGSMQVNSVFRKGIRKENMEYLETNYKDTTESIFDKLISLKTNSKFEKLCNFGGLDLDIRKDFSEQVYNGWVGRHGIIDTVTSKEKD